MPELKGQTIIEGSRPSSILVRVPAPATLSTPYGSSPDLEISGEGRFVGFVLVGDEPSTDETTLLGGRFPEGSDSTDFLMPIYPWLGGNYDFRKLYPDEVTLMPGRYRLYLLTDGAPIRITLHLGGLSGTTSLKPDQEATYRLQTPGPRLLGGQGVTRNVYSSGASGDLTNQGMIFQALWLKTERHVGGQFFLCHRVGPAPFEPADFGPACPAGENVFVNDRYIMLEEDTKLLMHGFAPLPQGEHGIGFWFALESIVVDFQNIAFWLSY